MDDVERIPIDIGYEVAAPAEQPSDPRTSVREDGTVLIDILMPQPCEPKPSTEGEIVVCAAALESGQLRPLPPPPAPNAMEILAEALSAKVGPVEIGSIDRGDGTRALGLRVRF